MLLSLQKLDLETTLDNLPSPYRPNPEEVGGEQVFYFKNTNAYRTFCERVLAAGFNFPQCLSGVDMEYGLRSVLHLRRLNDQAELTIWCDVPYDNPFIPSVSDLWSGVEWHEREAYDLFGIHYTNHPDLRRILLEDHWSTHPLQRRYDTGGYLIKDWKAKPWPNQEEINEQSKIESRVVKPPPHQTSKQSDSLNTSKVKK